DFSRKKPLAARKAVSVKPAKPTVDAVPKKKKADPVKKAASPREIPGMPLKKGMERYRIEVGYSHGVRAGDIVGAISNEAGLDSKYIKSVDINQDFSFVDLPSDMPKDIFKLLQNTWVRSQQMSISKHA
ncbi:MAG: DbpA RNA binding domain-containing protein, partial [Proteobacteria bacterium]|nr:DbpA RNA binding domain-containing protein [Pseudomonadota bacterium]